MQLAIQETLLLDGTTEERLVHAQRLGVAGIEFDGKGLTDRVPEIAQGLRAFGLRASAVNIGKVPLIHPELTERDNAIVTIRQAMANALDLGATGVIFIPQGDDTPRLPDLRPYKSSLELEIELLLNLLKSTLADLAYAMGAELLLAPTSRRETHLVQRLDQAVTVRRKSKDHPHLKIAADTGYMATEDEDVIGTLRDHIADVGYIRIRALNGDTSSEKRVDTLAVAGMLRTNQYNGWITVAGDPATSRGDLAEHIATLQKVLAG